MSAPSPKAGVAGVDGAVLRSRPSGQGRAAAGVCLPPRCQQSGQKDEKKEMNGDTWGEGDPRQGRGSPGPQTLRQQEVMTAVAAAS